MANHPMSRILPAELVKILVFHIFKVTLCILTLLTKCFLQPIYVSDQYFEDPK